MKWTEYPYDDEDLHRLVESFALGDDDAHQRITHALRRPDGEGPPSAYGAVWYLSRVYEPEFWSWRLDA